MNTPKHPIVLHIPHASVDIPHNTREQYCIDELQLWKEITDLTDWYSDELFNMPSARRVVAPVSRIVVDTERFTDDADEPMAQHGMGCIYYQGTLGTPIRNHLNQEQRRALLEAYYYRHHQSLEEAIQACVNEFDCCLVVDCHSFPDTAFKYEDNTNTPRPDICIGTHSNNTPPKLVAQLRDYFVEHKLTVSVNTPYKGCLLPEKFERNPKVTAVMIEVNRKIYIKKPGTNDCLYYGEKPQKLEGFDTTSQILQQAIINVSPRQLLDQK